MNATPYQNRSDDTQNWTNLYLKPHDCWIYHVNINFHHQYGISAAESQTSLCAKRPQQRRVTRNRCFRRLTELWQPKTGFCTACSELSPWMVPQHCIASCLSQSHPVLNKLTLVSFWQVMKMVAAWYMTLQQVEPFNFSPHIQWTADQCVFHQIITFF